jgi:hypothetical protein
MGVYCIPRAQCAIDLSELESILGSNNPQYIQQLDNRHKQLNLYYYQTALKLLTDGAVGNDTRSDDIAGALSFIINELVKKKHPYAFYNEDKLNIGLRRIGFLFEFPSEDHYMSNKGLPVSKSDGGSVPHNSLKKATTSFKRLNALCCKQVSMIGYGKLNTFRISWKKKIISAPQTKAILDENTISFIDTIFSPNFMYAKQIVNNSNRSRKKKIVRTKTISQSRKIPRRYTKESNWDGLPQDIQNEILSFLSIKEWTKMTLLSKHMFNMIDTKLLFPLRMNIGFIAIIGGDFSDEEE